MLHAVIEELEEQRDSIATFARAELRGQPDPQLETLRATNAELRERLKGQGLELKQAKAIAAQGERRSAGEDNGGAGAPLEVVAGLQRQLEEARRQNEQLQATVGQMGAGGDGAMGALTTQLQQAQTDLASSRAKADSLEAELRAARGAARDGAMAAGAAHDEELAKLKEMNRALRKQVDDAPKSSACVLS